MELVRGVPITEYCDRQRVTTRDRLKLFIDVCQAVQHAHLKGIIHRDIKPTNVLVTLHDGVPVVKVIDFGVAKAIGQELTDRTLFTHFSQMIGTPLDMSPEQAEMGGLDIDTRTDVYSLGVLFYELLTGTTPFDKERLKSAGFDEMRRIIREEEPETVSARIARTRRVGSAHQHSATDAPNAHCGGHSPPYTPAPSPQPSRLTELDWIVMKALEKDRRRRYESPSSLAADIQRYLADEPVQACPPSAVYRARKFVRRHKNGVLAAGLIGLCLCIVAVIGATTYSQRVTTQRQIAQDVQQSLAAAKTAIEAGDLSLAEKRVAEAKGRLGDHRSSLTATAADVDKLAAELDARRADQERFDKFIKLAREVQDKMGYSADLTGARLTREALDVYGVVGDPNWLDRLNRSYLTAEQKRIVQEAAYETLVLLADYAVRWRWGWTSSGQDPPLTLQQSLDFLERAQSFHEPTRAFWFVRRETHKALKNDQAMQDDDQRFQTAEAKNAWDYYLPGHSAGWAGNYDEQSRSYQAALRIQPDHFNSLFFFGQHLHTRKKDRLSEAAVYFTACIALRPREVGAYVSRARCHSELGHFDEAEADYSAAIAVAESDDIYKERSGFYQRWGRKTKAEQDLDRAIELRKEVLNRQQASLGWDHRETLETMVKLASDYRTSGKPELALALQDEAMQGFKAKLGPEHGETVKNMYRLAMMYEAAGSLDPTVLALYEQSFEFVKAKLGPERRETLISMLSLVILCEAAGKADRAALLREEMFGVMRQVTPPVKFKDVLASLNNFALKYLHEGKLDLALSILDPTYELMKSKVGPDDDNTVSTMANVADAYGAAGRFDEALPLAEGALKLRTARNGRESREALDGMDQLSLLYKDIGRIEEALELVGESAKVSEAKFGRENPDTLNSRNNLAVVYLAAGKADLALPLLKETLRAARAMLGPDHLYAFESILRLSTANLLLGKIDEALPLASETYELAKARFGPEHPLTIESMQNLADVNQAAGKLDEAEVLYQETLRLRKSKLAENHLDTLGTMASLGFNLFCQQKYAESERLLVAAYEGMKARNDKILVNGKPRLNVTLERLVELYTAWDKPDEAAKWRKELETQTAEQPK